MNINENLYQRELIDLFVKKGWKELDRNKNEAKDHLNAFRPKELGDFLQLKYPSIKASEIKEIFNKINSTISSTEWNKNNKFGINELLKNGISTEFTRDNGLKNYKLIDFIEPSNNILNIQEEVWVNFGSRMDIVQYINGLPVFIWELKTFAPSKGNLLSKAIKQIQRYTNIENPKIMTFNLGLFVSQGVEGTLIGSPSTKEEFWFKPFSTVGGIESMLDYFELDRIFNSVRWGVLFKKSTKDQTRILLRPHQYEAIYETNKNLLAGKGGYIWHTQGSGKTITIAALISSLQHYDGSASITTVVDVDRTELVDNILETIKSFDVAHINQNVTKAKSTEDLQGFLTKTRYRGVIVTTTQKFSDWGKVSDRKDILLISDEAHRTHSDKGVAISEGKTYLEKINEALPNAIKLGFTGTPIFNDDRSTYQQFGDQIHKYTMKDAEEDGIITEISFSFAKISLAINSENDLDEMQSSMINSSKIKNESPARNEELTDEIVRSFTFNKNRHEQAGFNDKYKAMVVTSSIKQGWIVYKMLQSKMSNANIKFVATPNKDKQEKEVYKFLSDEKKQKEWISKFKGPNSDIDIMVVTDKLLTGYDVPNLRIMYLDKEIKEHNLLQTIARVNRKFENKTMGYIVSFRNISKELESALNVYRNTTGDQSDLVRYITSSDHLFDSHIESLEEVIPIEYKDSGLAIYINELHYEYCNMDEDVQQKVRKALDEINSLSQIVYNIESKIKRYKIGISLYLRSLIVNEERNPNVNSYVNMSDEDIKKVLNSIEVDGSIIYTLSNKTLDEILNLKDVLPKEAFIKEVDIFTKKIIRSKASGNKEEMELLEKLKLIIKRYNDDLDEMIDFIKEINKIKTLEEQLENPSIWTKYLIDALKSGIEKVNFEQAEFLDEILKEQSNDWYETEPSKRNIQGKLMKALMNKDLFEGLSIMQADVIIEEFISKSIQEWGKYG